MKDHTRGVLLVSTTALMWGGLAIALKFTVAHVAAVNIVWFRFLVAFILLFAWTAFRRPELLRPLIRPDFKALLAGLFLAANYFAFQKAIELTTPANAQIIIQIAPLGLALCGVFLFGESFDRFQKLGFLVAGLGFLVFYQDQLQQMFAELDRYRTGNLFILVAAFAWIAYAVLNKLLLRSLNGTQINLVIYFVAAVLLSFIAKPGEMSDLGSGMWVLMVILACNTLVAYGCLAESFRYIPAYKVSFILILNPLITLGLMEVIGRLGLPELRPQALGWDGWLGALMVIGGSVVVTVRKR